MDARIVLLATTFAIAVLGCDRRRETISPPSKLKPPVKVDSSAAAAIAKDLPRSKQTRDAALKAEIDQLAIDGGLPSQVDRDAAPANDGRSIHARLTATMIGVPIALSIEELDPLVPTNGFHWDAASLEVARKVTSERNSVRRAIRKLLAGEPGPRLTAADAAASDLAYLDFWRVAHRLELLAAADAMASDKLADAVASLDAMTAMCERLAREPVVAARAEAARLRGDNGFLLQAICDHPRRDASTLQQLRKICARQATSLPDESEVWRGERIAGLAIYEAIRRGELMTVLPLEEIEKLTEEKRLEATKKAITRGIDLDQRHYLEIVRELIAACEQGPLDAQRAIADMKVKLGSWKEGPDFPYVATKLLLHDTARVHEILSQDRALCDAWAMALDYAVSGAPPSGKTNAATGKPFEIGATADAITIGNLIVNGRSREIRVPRK